LITNWKITLNFRYAITRLKQAPDDDLLLYLLQLVQALKYENFDDKIDAYRADKDILKSIDDNGCDQSSTTSETTNSMNISINSQSIIYPQAEEPLDQSTLSGLSNRKEANEPINIGISNITRDESEITNTLCSDTNSVAPDLATFLIQRACRNSTLANYLFWYLSIECEEQETAPMRKQDERVRAMYVTVLETFMRTLSTGSADMKIIHANLKKQQCFIENLVKLVKTVAKESGNRKKKTEKFQQLLSDSDAFKINFSNFEPRPFPLDPNVYIKGVVSQKVTLFKSALMPSK
jgi:phosphatidylinositol 3-kinase